MFNRSRKCSIARKIDVSLNGLNLNVISVDELAYLAVKMGWCRPHALCDFKNGRRQLHQLTAVTVFNGERQHDIGIRVDLLIERRAGLKGVVGQYTGTEAVDRENRGVIE